MSVLYGVVKERGVLASEVELRSASAFTRRFAMADASLLVAGRVGMSLQPYTTHMRSVTDTRPLIDRTGNMLSFDGRLDNFQELADELGVDSDTMLDSAIVLFAFARWGEDCFARLTGDWALALWYARGQTMFLARDHAGTRSLYFALNGSQIRWATYLESLTVSNAELRLSEAYAAAYLSCTPTRDLTPYAGIQSVTPGHYFAFRRGTAVTRPHWSPLVQSSIRYKSDLEYDENFLEVFETAITRRSGTAESVLAQLSGGMDSTSIVCLSDHLRRSADPEAEILDTISFFDDSEASLDERRYFTVTEQRRGKVGIHLNVAYSQRTFTRPQPEFGTYQFPGADSFSVQQESVLFNAVYKRGYRAILSGIGGDEVLGGVPTGLPELADYLAAGKFRKLISRAVAWALPDRTPLGEVLYQTARYAAGVHFRTVSARGRIPAWMSRKLRAQLSELRTTANLVSASWGIEPHRVGNALTWWGIMETLPHLTPQNLFRPEYRYPMLDKDLVEYLFSIPPAQLVQPGRRRAMMRRALRDIVPVEILERPRKAFQQRAPLNALRNAYPDLRRTLSSLAMTDLGLVDADEFFRALKGAADGNLERYHSVFRAIAYELWLRGTMGHEQHASSAEGLQTSLAAF